MFKIKGLKKKATFNKIAKELEAQGFIIIREDRERPWGGFFAIKETQAKKFIETFFPYDDVKKLMKGGKVSPKILIVEPGKRLSWQYHKRRSEVWRVATGTVGVVVSKNDREGSSVVLMNPTDMITLKKGIRHRLVGLKEFGVVAEIWQHTDPKKKSNEADIIRLQDDFGR